MSNQREAEEHSWIWVEKFFKKIPVPYPIASLLIAGIIYLIFWFFSTKVVSFPWEFYHSFVASTLSILIAFQLVGIQYILNNIKKTFRELSSHTKNKTSIDSLYVKLKYRFSRSYWYYVIVTAVIAPFVVNDLMHILHDGNTFYSVETTIWSFLLDIYNYAAGYFMFFLMAIFLWIILNIILTLNEMRSDPYRYLIKIDIFNIDGIGGLGPLRDLISKILIFYFICITLAIISYISPFSIFSYESYFLIILLLVGVAFFLSSVGTIRKLLRGRIEDEINKINERYQLEHQKLMELVSEGSYKEEELSLVSTALQTLYVERERMLQLYGNARGYDIKTLVQFFSTFILSLAAFVEKLLQFGLEIKKFL